MVTAGASAWRQWEGASQVRGVVAHWPACILHQPAACTLPAQLATGFSAGLSWVNNFRGCNALSPLCVPACLHVYPCAAPPLPAPQSQTDTAAGAAEPSQWREARRSRPGAGAAAAFGSEPAAAKRQRVAAAAAPAAAAAAVPASPVCQHSAAIPATAVVYIEQPLPVQPPPPQQQQQLQQLQPPVQAVPVVDQQQVAAAAALQQQVVDLRQANAELKAQNDDWHAIADEERAARSRAEAALQDNCRQVGQRADVNSRCSGSLPMQWAGMPDRTQHLTTADRSVPAA